MDASIVIGLIALLVSIIVGVRQLILQGRVTKIEEARRIEEVMSSRMAEVTARFESYVIPRSAGALAHNFVLTNLGPATAQDVSFEIRTPEQGLAPMVQMEGHTFPISLDRGQSYEMMCAVAVGSAPSVVVDLAWKDGTGDRTKTLTLTVY